MELQTATDLLLFFYHQIRRIKSMKPVVKVSAGLDVHRKNIMATMRELIKKVWEVDPLHRFLTFLTFGARHKYFST